MVLLIDTDAFCKFAIAELLEEAISIVGGDIATCECLPALPHMLRRGRLRESLGGEACDRVLPLAASLRKLQPASPLLLDQFAAISEIDPGEAQLFAAAAERHCHVLTGDKRALRVLPSVPDVGQLLSGLIISCDQLWHILCDELGPEEVRRQTQSLHTCDHTLRLCFSPSQDDPRTGLQSYIRDLAAEMHPVLLWTTPM